MSTAPKPKPIADHGPDPPPTRKDFERFVTRILKVPRAELDRLLTRERERRKRHRLKARD